MEQGSGVGLGSQGNVGFVRQTSGKGFKAEGMALQRPRGMKAQTEEGWGLLQVQGGRDRDRSWKFTLSKVRIHGTCSDSRWRSRNDPGVSQGYRRDRRWGGKFCGQQAGGGKMEGDPGAPGGGCPEPAGRGGGAQAEEPGEDAGVGQPGKKERTHPIAGAQEVVRKEWGHSQTPSGGSEMRLKAFLGWEARCPHHQRVEQSGSILS